MKFNCNKMNIENFFDSFVKHEKFEFGKVFECSGSNYRLINSTNQLMIRVASYPENQHLAYKFNSFELSIIEYIMCKLKIQVIFQESIDKLMHPRLELVITPVRELYSFNQIIAQQLYWCEILTKSLIINDETYLPLIGIFDYQSWTLSIISLLIYFIILMLFNKNSKLNILDISSQVVQQSTKYFSKLSEIYLALKIRHYLSFSLIFISLFIWLIMSSILSHCFLSSLLKFFFKFKPVKPVETLEDVLANSDLNVAGNFSAQYLDTTIDELSFNNLIKNIEVYEQRMKITGMSDNPNNNFINKDILVDILSGKTVLIVNSFLRLIMQDTFNEFNLVTAEESYIMIFVSYKMSKNFTYTDQITRTVKACIETGIKSHWYFLRGLKKEMIGKEFIRQMNLETNKNLPSISNALAIDVKQIFKGPLLLLIIGNSISMVIIIIEIFVPTSVLKIIPIPVNST